MIKDYFLKVGTWVKTEAALPGALSLKKAVRHILGLLKVEHYDPCCDSSRLTRPVRFNTDTDQLEYYTGIVWVSVPGGVLPSTLSETYFIGGEGQPVAGNTIVDASLIGAAIIAVFVDGPNTVTYIFDSVTGTLDFTEMGGLVDGQIVTVIYNPAPEE